MQGRLSILSKCFPLDCWSVKGWVWGHILRRKQSNTTWPWHKAIYLHYPDVGPLIDVASGVDGKKFRGAVRHRATFSSDVLKQLFGVLVELQALLTSALNFNSPHILWPKLPKNITLLVMATVMLLWVAKMTPWFLLVKNSILIMPGKCVHILGSKLDQFKSNKVTNKNNCS